MKNKKNSIFLIVVPILCILIVALFAYDRYQTNQLAKKFKQDNQTVDTSKNNNQTSLENSVELFQEGIKLSKICSDKLAGIENKVAKILVDGKLEDLKIEE